MLYLSANKQEENQRKMPLDASPAAFPYSPQALQGRPLASGLAVEYNRQAD
jgi:hypothetical protein